MVDDWWEERLGRLKFQGAKDAELGVFELPNEESDPQNADENMAYRLGFDQRRKELGDKFEWA